MINLHSSDDNSTFKIWKSLSNTKNLKNSESPLNDNAQK